MSPQIAWLLRPPPGSAAGAAGEEPLQPAKAPQPAKALQKATAGPPVLPEPARRASGPSGDRGAGRGVRGNPLPSREAVLALPAFDTLPDEAIIMVDPEDAVRMGEEIRVAGVVGFDTESKPVFVRGQAQDGPHLVQFAVADRAWLFSLMEPACVSVVGELLALPALWKVGFGLAGDRIQLNQRFGRMPASLIDLDNVYRRMGYRVSTGIRMAMAVTFGRRFEKSKAIGKSDWSKQPLNQAQCRYAAHDAWGALRIYQELLAQGVDIRP